MAAGIDFRRYRKVRRFVARTFLAVVWWDVVLNVPGLRRFRRPPLSRYQEIARRYRTLAAEMGGVLIKLGQFLSTRVDVLPPEITDELAGLQDEVPPEPFPAIVRQIEEDFGGPVSAVFAWLGAEPIGAASLAQVHPARLATGEEVVAKVLRPGIDVLVETDLAAVRLAARLLRFSKTIRRRVDLGRLGSEITHTTRAELDLLAEGRNAERFAENFAADPRVYLPKVFWDWSARRTLTLENVGWIKIADLAALDRVGIPRPEVARALYRIYLRQIFEHFFVHADPHPGNLFVRPLPVEEEAPIQPGTAVPPPPADGGARPFQIVFVDFGMVAAIPERLRGALREYAIALGTRDAGRMVRSYVAAGVLLPGADLRRLEEIHEELFRRFWGVRIGNLRETALSEAEYFFRQYRDLLYELPFQMEVDLLFASRAVGLLAGLSTQLDPGFDPWAETLPFAQRLAAQEVRRDWREIAGEGLAQLQMLLGLPRRLDAVLARAERGTLTVQSALAPEDRKMIRRLERSIHRLSWTLLAAALGAAGVSLRADTPCLGAGRGGGAGFPVGLGEEELSYPPPPTVALFLQNPIARMPSRSVLFLLALSLLGGCRGPQDPGSPPPTADPSPDAEAAIAAAPGALTATGPAAYHGASSYFCVPHAGAGLQVDFRTGSQEMPAVVVRIADYRGGGPYRARLFVTGRSPSGGLATAQGEATVEISQQAAIEAGAPARVSGTFHGRYGGAAGGTIEGRFASCSYSSTRGGETPPMAGTGPTAGDLVGQPEDAGEESHERPSEASRLPAGPRVGNGGARSGRTTAGRRSGKPRSPHGSGRSRGRRGRGSRVRGAG